VRVQLCESAESQSSMLRITAAHQTEEKKIMETLQSHLRTDEGISAPPVVQGQGLVGDMAPTRDSEAGIGIVTSKSLR